MNQLPLLIPTSHGEQPAEPLAAKLLHRRGDPATSVVASVKSSVRLADGKSLALFLHHLGTDELTVLEVARKTINPGHWNHEFAKRVKAWSVAGHIELTGDVRNGGRVWKRTED